MKTSKLNLKLYILIFSFVAIGLPIQRQQEALAQEQEKKTYGLEHFYSRFSSWGISPKEKMAGINLSKAWKIFKKNKDIVVAVIDTGVHPEHSFIKDNLHVEEGIFGPHNYGVDFSIKSKTQIQSSKASFQTTTPRDGHGHGTHVNGIIKSVFPDVKILSLKYYNPNVSGKENLIAAVKALRYAVEKNVNIINYSGGGPEMSSEELRILRLAEKKGILIVAAAGNEKSNIDDKRHAYYPASYNLPNIITVMAHDKNAKILNFSNYGKLNVDISAPGHGIRSSFPHEQAGKLTGTSQATAFVTGVTALIKSQFPKLSAVQIKKIIRNSARKRKSLEGKCITGGILDAEKALRMSSNIYRKGPKTKRGVAEKVKKRNVIIKKKQKQKQKQKKIPKAAIPEKKLRKVIYYYRKNR